MKRLPLAVGGLAALALGAALLAHRGRSPLPVPARALAVSPLAHADARYASKPKAAASEYESFVAKNERSPDPKVQDGVGAARMRLGYLAAKEHDLPAARAVFLQAAAVKGTGTMGAFGTVSDQAAYQEAVCLAAQGKKADAIREFERYLRERPLSALARAAHRRLALLNGGASRPEWDALMQNAVAQQEARVRFETSVCGPKCLEHILFGDRSPSSAIASEPKRVDYKTLARLCGTTDDGTTVEGMRRGLKALGHESWAYRLSRADLPKAKLPAAMLQGDHYVVVERVAGDEATVWDPRFGRTEPWRLPPQDDPNFTATLILLAKPEGM